MSDRSPIFNAKGVQIGYIEGDHAFDLAGRECCKYTRATGNLTEMNGKKIVGHISLDGTLIGLSWISDELFGKPSGEVYPDRAFRKPRLHQIPKKSQIQRSETSKIEEREDGSPPTATVAQLENSVEHSSISRAGGDSELGSDASEKVADEVPVARPEPTVVEPTPTKSPSTQDELVGRAIGMIRGALENRSE
jgi:hypothetical protein